MKATIRCRLSGHRLLLIQIAQIVAAPFSFNLGLRLCVSELLSRICLRGLGLGRMWSHGRAG